MDLELVIIAALLVSLIVLMLSVKKKYLFYNSILGICVLFIVNILSGLTGIYLGFGIYTILFSVILGIPAVVALILIKVL